MRRSKGGSLGLRELSRLFWEQCQALQQFYEQIAISFTRFGVIELRELVVPPQFEAEPILHSKVQDAQKLTEPRK